jgi:hypothetical protein
MLQMKSLRQTSATNFTFYLGLEPGITLSMILLSSYTISSKLLHQCWLSLQDLSNNNWVRLFWVPCHCDIKDNGEADRLVRMGSDSLFCGPESSEMIDDLECLRLMGGELGLLVSCFSSARKTLRSFCLGLGPFWR